MKKLFLKDIILKSFVPSILKKEEYKKIRGGVDILLTLCCETIDPETNCHHISLEPQTPHNGSGSGTNEKGSSLSELYISRE